MPTSVSAVASRSWTCLLALFLAASAPAQGTASASAPGKGAAIGPDPYTEGKQAILTKANYVRFAPFQFGGNHTTGEVEALLGHKNIAWIETKHFRLGCSLSPLKAKSPAVWGKKWGASLKRELTTLRKRIPSIKKPKVLDPWVRAHLFAHRLEKLYDDVSGNLELGRNGDEVDQEIVVGPYLGMTEKAAVLLLQKRSDHARYTRAYHGREMGDPIRLHDGHFDCMYWGASEETAENLFASDFALHTHVTYNVAHNLYSGYRTFRRPLPAWLITGLCHFHARQISPRFPTHDRPSTEDGGGSKHSAFWKWDERIGGLVKNEALEPLDKLFDRKSSHDFEVEQHMHAWSVVAFLAEHHKAKLFRFVHLVKGSGVSQRDAFHQAFDCEVTEIDAAWQKNATKRKRRR
ncbi:MAG: hypothetical protein ACI91B_004039 [Planctomycetota bacterium]|jgi:hypothetical protein